MFSRKFVYAFFVLTCVLKRREKKLFVSANISFHFVFTQEISLGEATCRCIQWHVCRLHENACTVIFVCSCEFGLMTHQRQTQVLYSMYWLQSIVGSSDGAKYCSRTIETTKVIFVYSSFKKIQICKNDLPVEMKEATWALEKKAGCAQYNLLFFKIDCFLKSMANFIECVQTSDSCSWINFTWLSTVTISIAILTYSTEFWSF